MFFADAEKTRIKFGFRSHRPAEWEPMTCYDASIRMETLSPVDTHIHSDFEVKKSPFSLRNAAKLTGIAAILGLLAKVGLDKLKTLTWPEMLQGFADVDHFSEDVLGFGVLNFLGRGR